MKSLILALVLGLSFASSAMAEHVHDFNPMPNPDSGIVPMPTVPPIPNQEILPPVTPDISIPQPSGSSGESSGITMPIYPTK